MQKTTVLVVDDHKAIIEGVKSALKAHPKFELIGDCVDGQTALESIKTKKPDIVILDISMPNMDGIEVTEKVHKLELKTHIVIYTMHSESQFVVDLFKSGISAFVLKEDPLSDLVRALETVSHGGTYFSRKAPTILARHLKELEIIVRKKDELNILSKREREVFLLLAEGKKAYEIADQLFISPKTVESHKYNILDKLKASSVVDLTRLAIRKKLIDA